MVGNRFMTLYISLATCLYPTNYKAEAAAHTEVSTPTSHSVVLLTDALQALQSNMDADHNDPPSALASVCRSHVVTLKWIPSHCNVRAMRLLTPWQSRVQQRSKWIGLPWGEDHPQGQATQQVEARAPTVQLDRPSNQTGTSDSVQAQDSPHPPQPSPVF